MAYLQIIATYFGFLAFGGLLAVIRRWVRPGAKTPSALRKGPGYILLNLVFLLAIWLPRETHAFTLLVALLAAAASWEISGALGLARPPRLILSLMVGGLIVSAGWLAPADLLRLWAGLLLVTLPVVSLLPPASSYSLHETSPLSHGNGVVRRSLLGLAAGLAYLPVCLVPLVWLWQQDPGGYRTAFFYLVIAVNDAFSQFVGQLVGRTPLAPAVSPTKTIEGSLGGLIFAALLGAALSAFSGWSLPQAMLLAGLVALAGQVGDLTESAWKRALGRKDFSATLGSQGGILDRYDAFIFAAPLFCLLVVI